MDKSNINNLSDEELCQKVINNKNIYTQLKKEVIQLHELNTKIELQNKIIEINYKIIERLENELKRVKAINNSEN